MGKDGLQVMQKTDHCSSDLCPFASPTSTLPLLLPPYSSHISSIFVLEKPGVSLPYIRPATHRGSVRDPAIAPSP